MEDLHLFGLYFSFFLFYGMMHGKEREWHDCSGSGKTQRRKRPGPGAQMHAAGRGLFARGELYGYLGNRPSGDPLRAG